MAAREDQREGLQNHLKIGNNRICSFFQIVQKQGYIQENLFEKQGSYGTYEDHNPEIWHGNAVQHNYHTVYGSDLKIYEKNLWLQEEGSELP